MSGGNRATKCDKVCAILVCISMILGGCFFTIFLHIPTVSAGSVTLNVGDLWIEQLSDFGKILKGFTWNSQAQDIRDPMTTWGYDGLVMDTDNYDHTPGSENIADSYQAWPYGIQDDFTVVTGGSLLIDDGTTQKSFATFKNSGAGTGDPNDILINQTCWSVANKDWVILQWTLYNIKSVDITNVALGLEIPLSHALGPNGGVGGDNGDDIDGYDGAEDVYWAQDDSGVTIGFGSAIISDPITHYYSQDYYDTYTWDQYKTVYQNDTWLYNRIRAPNTVVGATPGNRSSTVGWDGFTLSPGSPRTVTLVVAVNNTFDNMKAAVADARNYYQTLVSGLQITEFSDDSAVQRIELYNDGLPPTDLAAEGYSLSNDGGVTFLPGTWNPTVIPTYGYSVFTVTGTPIGPEGDSISLWQDPGGGYQLVDGPFAFGQEGPVPDPLDGDSVARHFDTGTGEYTNDWLQTDLGGSTWGAQNNVGIVVLSPEVVLNRVMFNPFDITESYIEVHYRGFPIAIDNYRIVCDDEFFVPPGTTLDDSNPFFILNYTMAPAFFNNMDAAGDNIYLYNSAGNRLDMVGWSSPHTQGRFMARVPDGNGTFEGYDDNSSIAAGWVFDLAAGMLITEILVDAPNAAMIEVYNPRGGDEVPVPGVWDLECDAGVMTGTWNPSPIPAGGYSVFTQSGGANANLEGDTISLIFDSSSTIDTASFGTRGRIPDPLFGESSGRWWNSVVNGYSNDWNRNASTGPTWGAQNDVPPVDHTPDIILNEVMFYPTVPAGYYLGIYNIRSYDINVTEFNIICDDIYSFSDDFSSLNIPGFSLVILRYIDLGATFQTMCDSMDTPEDNVYLYDDNGQLLDMVGWSTAHFQGMAVRRVPLGNGTYDGYDDTSSEAAGWVFDSPIPVLLTEISDDGGSSQIEVYNSYYPTIDFSLGGYAFENRTGFITGVWTDSTAGPGEYAVFDVDPDQLHGQGDIVGFYQNGILIDEFGYGQYGTVPDPLDGESVQRYWDGTEYTEYWERNLATGPNFGFQNDVPPPELMASLMLNEVLFNPILVGDFFVELYYNGTSSLNISGWRIVGDMEYIIPQGIVLNISNRFFYLLYAMDPPFFDPANFDRTGDNIYLYTNNGSIVDMVGWSSLHVQGESMLRNPDGNGTRYGYDDPSSRAAGWFFNGTPIPPPPPSPPAPPMDLSAKLVSNGMDVMLSWNASDDDGKGEDDVAGYTVYKSSTSINGSYGYEAWVPTSGSSSYIWTDINAGDGDWNNYFYKIRANDTSGNEEQNNETAGKFVNYLLDDWNMISVPFMQADNSITYVLQTISSNLIAIQGYHAGKSRPWLHWHTSKPPHFNDIITIDHKGGYYVKMQNPDYLVVAGRTPSNTQIPLKTGWNLVGYPCLLNKTVDDALSSVAGKYNMVEYYDPILDKEVRLGPSDYMQPGLGYWIHATEDCILVI